MTGQRFTVVKRYVAMFCVGLCVALSAQMTIVVLDRMKHVFQIEHAPTPLAGPVFDHGHHLKVEVRHASDQSQAVHDHDGGPPHTHSDQYIDVAHDHDAVPVDVAHDHDATPSGFHTHDGLPQGHDHGPITHHHHGIGMLTPWLVSVSLQIVALPAKPTVFEFGVTGHPDAPAWRRDRPPKLDLERIV